MERKVRLVFLILTISFNNHLIHCQVVNQGDDQIVQSSFLPQKYIDNTNSDFNSKNNGNFWIDLDAGVYFMPFLLENDFSQLVNKTEPSFSFTVSITYSFNEFHSLNLGVGRFETEIITESIHLNINSNYECYPFNLTYYYQFDEIFHNIKPFIGIGLIYIYIESNQVIEEIESKPKIWRSNSTYNGYGIDGSFGLNFFLNNRFQLRTSIVLQYINGAGFSSYSYNILDFSGVQLNIGIGYNI